MLNKKIYGVSEITGFIKDAIDNASLRDIWIEGEISNFRKAAGNYFFYLKDEFSILRCVMFSVPDIELKDGMKVLAKGDIRVYERRGYYQLYVREIKRSGIGELFLKYLELKKKLEKEGLFDESHKKPLPWLPNKIGVITSVDGAAIKDIIKVIRKRFPVHIVLYPVRVQGDGAAAEIANAIEKMNARKDIDVIIVGRGGGSWEDLWAFNEEIVARAIYNSKIPIISAVGHERDYTIADFVADMRAPAPSAAAEMAVPDMRDVEARLLSMVARMEGAVRNRVERMKGRLDMFNEERFLREIRRAVDRNEENLNRLKEMLIFLVKRKVEVLRENIEMLSRVLDSSSPYKALERGYAMVMLSNNEIFKSVDDVDVGDVVRVRVKDGETKCQVKEKKKI